MREVGHKYDGNDKRRHWLPASAVWRPGIRLDILPLWNRAASIENGTAGATNTAPASNTTSTKNLTCQRIVIGKGATSRRSMNCLGEMRLLTMPRGP